MDRLRYDDRAWSDSEVLDVSLRQSQDLIERWHGRDDGRLLYAVTPRFAVSCSAEMLRESAALAASTGAYWQTHLAEDRHEIDEVRELFPEATDYTDVYDRAGGLGPKSIFGARDPPVRARDRAAGETGIAHRPLPGVEPVPGERRDAAGALPRGGAHRWAGERRRRRARTSASSP